jgi:hypothetical protein
LIDPGRLGGRAQRRGGRRSPGIGAGRVRRRGNRACEETQTAVCDQLERIVACPHPQIVAAGVPRQPLGGRQQLDLDQTLHRGLPPARREQRPDDQLVADLGIGQADQVSRLPGVDAQTWRPRGALDLDRLRRGRRHAENDPPLRRGALDRRRQRAPQREA